MIQKVIFLSLLLAVQMILPLEARSKSNASEQEFFPFIAEVTRNNVNIRAGQNSNFEKIIQLNKGEKVYVIEKSFSWYKIRLPENVSVYIHKKYLEFSNNKKSAVVTGDRINIRAGKAIYSSVLGQAHEGEEVLIVDLDGDWAAIKPTVGTSGWVKDEFLTFNSKDVSGFTQKSSRSLSDKDSNDVSAALLVKQEKEKHLVEKKEITGKPFESLDNTEVIFATGYLEKMKTSFDQQDQYIFTVDDKPTFVIARFNAVLDQFLYYKVQIEGTLDNNQTASYPVLNVSKIQLVY